MDPKTGQVDLQVQGYRPPLSALTDELSNFNLARHNYEWLANSAHSFGFEESKLENGIVKIPIHMDDYELFTGKTDLHSWTTRIREMAASRKFFCFSLHDCYGECWEPVIEGLLVELSSQYDFINGNQLADWHFQTSSKTSISWN